jgi:hypothetical protein
MTYIKKAVKWYFDRAAQVYALTSNPLFDQKV